MSKAQGTHFYPSWLHKIFLRFSHIGVSHVSSKPSEADSFARQPPPYGSEVPRELSPWATTVPVFFTACSSCAACVSAGWGDRCFAGEWWGVVVRLAVMENGVRDSAWRRSPRPGREHVCPNQNGSVSVVS